jgi:hypothetical protein
MNQDNYFDIYKNCPHLRILTMTNKDGLLAGRALVWNVETEKHGKITFMDRIYVVEDYMYEMFLNYAHENGWWRKSEYRKYERRGAWVNPETDKEEEIWVKIHTPTDFTSYPYIDTFSYGGDGYLQNRQANNYIYTYNETNGGREGDSNYDEDHEDDHEGEIYDEIADEWISEDDYVHLHHLGERQYRERNTHRHNAVQALLPTRSTGWFHENDDNVVCVSGRYYHTDHEDVVCREDGDWDLSENCVLCETDSEYYESDDSNMFKSSEGLYYHKENDDDVIFVQNRKEGEEGTYEYKPDLDDDAVIYVYDNWEWYWANDRRLVKIDFHMGSTCEIIYTFKDHLIKKGRKYYHPDDYRLRKNKSTTTTREAQTA